MASVVTDRLYGLYDKVFRKDAAFSRLPRPTTTSVLSHPVKFHVPYLIRNASIAARWVGVLAVTLLYFGSPRSMLQYAPLIGRFFNPEGRYLKPVLGQE